VSYRKCAWGRMGHCPPLLIFEKQPRFNGAIHTGYDVALDPPAHLPNLVRQVRQPLDDRKFGEAIEGHVMIQQARLAPNAMDHRFTGVWSAEVGSKSRLTETGRWSKRTRTSAQLVTRFMVRATGGAARPDGGADSLKTKLTHGSIESTQDARDFRRPRR
jgi:hypothetical protein